MEDRTELKEKRNSYLWLFWIAFTIVVSISLEFIFGFKADKPLEATAMWAFGLQLLAVVYRVLTFCFNSFLAKIVKRRWKIDRLKGRVSPIYKVVEKYDYFKIYKYSVEYTELDLDWSVPFSILFLEQEYIQEDFYTVISNIKKVDDIGKYYEEQYLINQSEISAKKLKRDEKKQKIDNLNKTFDENYK